MSIYLLYCSCVLCRQEVTTQNLKAHHQKHHIPKGNCLQCDVPIFKSRNKFCSSSCSARYNHKRRDYSVFKPGPKPKPKSKSKLEFPHKNSIRHENGAPYTKITQCIICNGYHARVGKTCSTKCKSKYISIIMKKKIQNGYNPNKHRGRGKQSYLEFSFQAWLLSNKITKFETESPFKIYDENNKYLTTYFADFYFPSMDLIIELDGTQHNKPTAIEYDKQRDASISSTYDVKIVRIAHKEYVSKQRLTEIKSLLGI